MLKIIWKSKIRAVWDRLWGWMALALLGSGAVLGVIWLIHAGVEAILPGFCKMLEWCGEHAVLVLAVLVAACLVCVYLEGRIEEREAEEDVTYVEGEVCE